jgi:anti-repressor protein
VANDIGNTLGTTNIHKTMVGLEEYEKRKLTIGYTLGCRQLTSVLTKTGLYSIILKSIAKEFKRWVLIEVLPSIRKTDTYNIQDNIDKQKENLAK